ncbi:MAG TPA: feruloyl-CoA synthase [Burkholderiaceae bacterium]
MSKPSTESAPRVLRIDRSDGSFTLRSPEPLQAYARCVGEWLEHWARETPGATAFAEPAAAGEWTRLSWRDLRQRVGAVAQALLDLKLPASRPILVLSDNGLDHLVLLLAGMHIGTAVCSVSSAYCRLAQGDFTRLHAILRILAPGLVYASNAETYAPALAGAGIDALAVFSAGASTTPGGLSFAHLLTAQETLAVMDAFTALTPDTHAKYLLTSGSTGQPKVVINTHRMLCANQQMLAQGWRAVLEGHKPVLLDWLPWSHTFGGNHNTNLVLRSGGTMYIDDGRPIPGAAGIEKTLTHLRTVQPTLHFNVPRGYEMMLPALEADRQLAQHFFARLRMVFYAGSGMPPSTWQRLEALAGAVRSNPVFMTTSWGSTETSPAATALTWQAEGPGLIGLPLPGVTLKFVPNAGKFEMRVKGDHIFPGYRGNEVATREAFDAEGFYRIGDAGRLADPLDASQGIVFDGRVAEDFKLSSGTWVSVGTLRVTLVSALAPHALDVVITGHDRSEVGALIFLTENARRLPFEQVSQQVRERLQALRAERGGSSQAPTRALLLEGSPDAAVGEITDKGYLNQRLVLERRAAEVEALYATPCSARVILA